MTSHDGTCSECGAPRPDPAIPCPACLLRLGLPSARPDEPTRPRIHAAASHATDGAPDHVGPYRLTRVLGEGGFGIVYLAEQEVPLRRQVALKLIKLGMDSREIIARFEAEQHALALMNHAGIAKVLDAGMTERGTPYFVMEHVPGQPITEHCDRNLLGTRARLELFVQVCEAVQHAHQKGIVHRDLKPSNILVAVEDGRPRPKVIDFGISKALDQRTQERTLFTARGVFIGTPAYMAPEQTDPLGLGIDTTTDVYSLGVLLYELLAGCLPFDAARLNSIAYDEMLRVIREEDPLPLPARLRTLGATSAEVAARRRTSSASLTREVQGDLDWITHKALEKQPARRYASVSELAADVMRHLADEPVVAGPPGLSYVLAKAVRRHRLAVAIGATFVGLLAAFGVVATWQATRLARARDGERVARLDAQAKAVDLREAWRLARRRAYAASIAASSASLESGDVLEAKRSLASCEEELRGWEWHHLSLEADSAETTFVAGAHVVAIAHTADGATLRAAVTTGLRSWDLATGQPRDSWTATLPDTPKGYVPVVLAVSPDGSTVLVRQEWVPDWSGHFVNLEQDTDDATKPKPRLALLDVASGAVRVLEGISDNALSACAFSPDGSLLATIDWSGLALLEKEHSARERRRTWDVRTGRPVAELSGRIPAATSITVYQLTPACAFSPDGALLLTGGTLVGAAAIWRPREHVPILVMPSRGNSVTAVSWSADSERTAFAALDVAAVWDVGTRKRLLEVQVKGSITAIALSSDGGRVALATSDGIDVRNVATGQSDALLRGHEGLVTSLAWAGDLICSGSEDGTVRTWRVGRATHGASAVVDASSERWMVSAAASPDGRRLALHYLNRGVVTTRLPDDAEALHFPPDGISMSRGLHALDGTAFASAFSPDGRLLARALGPWLSLEDIETGKSRKLLSNVALDGQGEEKPILRPGVREVTGVAYAHDGSRLACCARDGVVRILSLPQGELLHELPAGKAELSCVAMAKNGALAAGDADGTTWIWKDSSAGTPLRVPSASGAIMSLAFAPDAAHVAVGTRRGPTLLIATATGRVEHELIGHEGEVHALAFSPDGLRLASGSTDAAIRIWDPELGDALGVLRGHRGSVLLLAYSPDGKTLLSASVDQTVREWFSTR